MSRSPCFQWSLKRIMDWNILGRCPAIVSSAFVGVLFLALCVGIIMFKYGRRKNSAETMPSAGVKTGENQYYGCQNGDYEYEMVNRDNDYYAR